MFNMLMQGVIQFLRAAETVKENLYPNNLDLLKAEEELNLIKVYFFILEFRISC